MTPVMEIMRRAGILPENLRHQQPDMFNCIKTAIAIAQTEAIKEAAQDAERYINGMPEPLGSEVSESILQLLNQIK